jgi:excisionase family DNA binding protein
METNGKKPQDEISLLEVYNRQEEIFKKLEMISDQQQEMILVRKDVLSFAEGIKYLDLSDSHVYKLTAKRKIPHYKQGKLIYFVREELDKWLTKNRVKTKEELEVEATARLRKLRA